MKRLVFLIIFAALAAGVGRASDTDNIVVIVNPESGVDRLSRDEVIDIFLGRYRKLPSGRVALPIDVASSAERDQFYLLLVKKSPAEISSYWARLVFSGQTSPPYRVPDTRTAVELVESNPNA